MIRSLGTILTHTAAAAGSTSGDVELNFSNASKILIFVNVTAITGTAPTLTVTLQGKSPQGVYYTLLASAALTATGLTVLRVFPAATATANISANDILPETLRISTVIGGTTPAVTATIAAVLAS